MDKSKWHSQVWEWVNNYTDSIYRQFRSVKPVHAPGDVTPMPAGNNSASSFSVHNHHDPIYQTYYTAIHHTTITDPTSTVRHLLQRQDATPTQLVEASLRAWRNILLDEAVELQAALRYWNHRSERPWLAWIETGKFHTVSIAAHRALVTNKVTTLQAVLARRCAAVGELQQHLLQAGWHHGVAQWAVLAGWDAPLAMASQSGQTPDDPIGAGTYPLRRRTSRVVVGKQDGDGIFVDDPSFVQEWTVGALELVVRQVERAGTGRIQCCSFGGEDFYEDEDDIMTSDNFAREIADLLDCMQAASQIQRQRRLNGLCGYSWVRRNWYILALSVPIVWTVGRRLRFRGSVTLLFTKMAAVVRERVAEPLTSIFREIWRGRESFSDQMARQAAIASLKKMLRTWLDETYPDMPSLERESMAEAMDIRLLEAKKEESMKTFYEINNVIRMSFIEMQYMKKEMMNALHAIDEIMSANDINMNLAAITPVALLGYVNVRSFRFCFYALLKLGKSRDETYASFRNIITDIERLLVMRNNPPNSVGPSVLGADDLGMSMLLIHECRSILRTDRRRFSTSVIRSVSEDLAELAGERGAVSVQQQLSIVERMTRTYPFMKVVRP